MTPPLALGIRTARKTLPALVRNIATTPITLTYRGRPVAEIVAVGTVAERDRLRERLDVLVWMREWAASYTGDAGHTITSACDAYEGAARGDLDPIGERVAGRSDLAGLAAREAAGWRAIARDVPPGTPPGELDPIGEGLEAWARAIEGAR